MKDKPKVKIQFPSLLVIPVLSILWSIAKLCNMTDCSWMTAIVVVPMALYFLWCIGYCAIAILAIWMYRTIKGN